MFYGWYIVAAGVLLNACYSGIIGYGFTAFIEPIALTFGWSYTQISLATSLRGLESGAMNPLVGILVDRYPARPLSLIGMVIFAVGLFCISRVTSLAMFYVGFIIIGLGTSIAIHMIPQTSLVSWFRRDVGKASGVLFMGSGLGGLFIPGLIMLIDAFGWQNALLFLSIGILAMGIALSFLYRESPGGHGLLPGGNSEEGSPESVFSGVSDFGMGVKEALRTRAFWQIGVATTLQMAGVMAVITHIMPYLSSIGVERSVGGMVAMSIPVVSLVSRIPFGWLCDIFDKRHVLASSIGLGSIGFFLLWLVGPGTYGLITAFVVFMGLGIGGLMPTRLPIYSEYFGPRNFGKIYGLASIFITVGFVGGPPLAGWVYDTLGIFDPVWLAMSGANAIGVIIILTTPPAFGDPGRRAGRAGNP